MLPIKTKTILSLICICLVALLSCNSQKTDGLFLIVMDDKYGYIDQTGKIVINPQFDWASNFSESMAVVRVGEGTYGKYGYIDTKGNIVINPHFDDAQTFSEDLAQVKIEGKYGFINKSGKIVINPKFVDAGNFHEGLAKVRIGGNKNSTEGQKWGYIGKNGSYTIEPKYEFVRDFSEGVACVKRDGVGFSLIDKNGKEFETTVAQIFNDCGKFSQGFVPFKSTFNDKWGYIGRNGNLAIAPQFDWADSFMGKLARVQIGNKWGFIDEYGEIATQGAGNSETFILKSRMVVKPEFDYAENFSEGVALVGVGGKLGFINSTGKFTINPQFEAFVNPQDNYVAYEGNATGFSDGLAGIKVKDEWAYIDATGKFIWNPSK